MVTVGLAADADLAAVRAFAASVDIENGTLAGRTDVFIGPWGVGTSRSALVVSDDGTTLPLRMMKASAPTPAFTAQDTAHEATTASGKSTNMTAAAVLVGTTLHIVYTKTSVAALSY